MSEMATGQSNAALMAVAHELLEYLQYAVWAHPELAKNKKLMAAIAKATGQKEGQEATGQDPHHAVAADGAAFGGQRKVSARAFASSLSGNAARYQHQRRCHASPCAGVD